MHRSADMNISLIYFFEFFTLEEHELERISYIKDIVLYEGISTKFVSCFSKFYFISYGFSKFVNEEA
jgi:hypothetical protein